MSENLIEMQNLELHRDERGFLIEFLRGDRQALAPCGQVYLTTANPGYIKGNHYHCRKTEYFLIIGGRGKFRAVEVASGRSQELAVDAAAPLLLKVPPLVAHAFANAGPERLDILAFIDESYNPLDPDTRAYAVLGPADCAVGGGAA